MKYLAIDIGAREVKASVAEIYKGNLLIKKVQSFRINLIKRDGHLFWPLDSIYERILRILAEAGKVDYIKIDGFHSDFVLLDANDNIIGGAVSYLDERTERIQNLPDSRYVFDRTLAHMRANTTLYQLIALKEESPEVLEAASSLLFLPDYFNFLLTGVKKTSLSIALTSTLVNAETNDWDEELLSLSGLSAAIMPEIISDGEILSELKDEIAKEAGYNASLFVSSHDTSLAYLSAPLDDETLMLSVGGFSRLGAIVDDKMGSDDIFEKNYTNALTPLKEKTLTKYLMGTYLIQRLKEGMKVGTSYDEIMKRSRSIHASDPIDISLISYEERNVLAAINRAREEEDLEPIEDLFVASSIIYTSLASYYVSEIEKMEESLGRDIKKIALVGGASKDFYLALLLAMKGKKEIIATSTDAALIGNLVFQALEIGEIERDGKDDIIKKALGRTTFRP